jgi:hypothetical protein
LAAAGSDKLADLTGALAEFAGRLGLADADKAALLAEIDALRAEMLWQRGDADTSAGRLRTIRGLLASAEGNSLAAAALREVDALLNEP